MMMNDIWLRFYLVVLWMMLLARRLEKNTYTAIAVDDASVVALSLPSLAGFCWFSHTKIWRSCYTFLYLSTVCDACLFETFDPFVTVTELLRTSNHTGENTRNGRYMVVCCECWESYLMLSSVCLSVCVWYICCMWFDGRLFKELINIVESCLAGCWRSLECLM